MAILTYNKSVKSYTKPPKVKDKGTAFGSIIESIRRRVQIYYPNAVFDTAFVIGISESSWAEYIEQQFQPGMSWENYNETWQLRSICQPKHFDMTKAQEFYAFFRHTNFRPEWKKIKGFVAYPNKVSSVDRYAD